MKVFDRYLGTSVALPDKVEPGRYRLLRRAMLNGKTALEERVLLMSDGYDYCVLDGELRHFCETAHRADGDAVASLILRSVQTLAAQYRAQPSAPPSPLIPGELANSVRLDERDEALRQVIDKGHLGEIARRPRYAMKYEAEITQIHRVRRMAPKAVEHLAAHSEDWHSQSLFGVLPKRLLALLSEDDWSIYENKVYARLLDELDDYLRWRLAETQQINVKYEEKRKLEQSEHIHHRLRDRLFELWGDAIDPDEMAQGLEDSRAAIEFLQAAKMHVGMLRQSELYCKVPRSARVAAQLRNTNILMHDSHYRHLRTLWGKYQTRASKQQRPEQVFAGNLQALDDFAHYLRMMIHRVMSTMALVGTQSGSDGIVFAFGQAQGRVSFADTEITISLDERTLVIVPALTEPVDSADTMKPDGTGRLVIACLPSILRTDVPEFAPQHAERYVINPLNFYGEERLMWLIERFLWFPVFEAYGRFIGPLPREVLEWFEQRKLGTVENHQWRADRSSSVIEHKELHACLSSTALNAETKAKISRALDRTNLLSLCRHCGEPAKFTPRGGDFTARCEYCGTHWGVYRRNARRFGEMGVASAREERFERVGSWSSLFEV
ncbi:hypothetical protein AWB78_08208 [Caballeronia calidae]|uniref:DUF2357 domain-containing protein n=1 Tax=Caballeronia calidae TaxID=1777139 RepID=A0A158ELC1_9BURK|nr:hypothetical protein [Caballeronia calidae]SAL06717.1 hypothetical protein AWB78_08208 [Caballeronia calidae]